MTVRVIGTAIRGWKPFVLADEVWGSLAIELVIQLHQKKVYKLFKIGGLFF